MAAEESSSEARARDALSKGLEGRDVVGDDGARLGTVVSVYADDLSDAYEWVSVRMDGSEPDRLVPLAEADIEGDALVVPYAREIVLAAPAFGGGGHLTATEEAQLCAHYDLEYSTPESETGLPTAGLPPAGAPEPPLSREPSSGA